MSPADPSRRVIDLAAIDDAVSRAADLFAQGAGVGGCLRGLAQDCAGMDARDIGFALVSLAAAEEAMFQGNAARLRSDRAWRAAGLVMATVFAASAEGRDATGADLAEW